MVSKQRIYRLQPACEYFGDELVIGSLALVDAGYGKAAEVDGPDAIDDCLPQPHWLSGEDLAHPVAMSVQRHGSVAHSPYQEVWSILQRRQGFWIGPLAWLIAADRRLEVAGLVWTFEVVDRAPAVEGSLGMAGVGVPGAVEQLGLERAVEALLLALGLRVVGSPVTDADTQLQQPEAKPRPRATARIAPGTAVVGQDPVGQTGAPKRDHELLADRCSQLVGTGIQDDAVARMVVQRRQWVQPPRSLRQGYVALETELPELVGCGELEALPGMLLARGCR